MSRYSSDFAELVSLLKSLRNDFNTVIKLNIFSIEDVKTFDLTVKEIIDKIRLLSLNIEDTIIDLENEIEDKSIQREKSDLTIDWSDLD